jgi:small-conductance mechanosensitive channel
MQIRTVDAECLPGERKREWRPFVLGILCFFLLGGVAAAHAAPDTPAPATAPGDRADVIIDGRVLFPVAGVSAYPAHFRAARIADTIRGLADDSAFSIDQLRTVDLPEENRILVNVGDRNLFSIFDRDAELEGISRSVAVMVVVHSVGEAITRYRQERTREYLVRAGASVAGILVGVLGALALLRWIGGSVFRRLQGSHQRVLQGLESKSYGMLDANQFEHAIRSLLKSLWWLAVVTLSFVGATTGLALFPWTRGFSRWVFGVVVDPLQTMGTAILRSVPDLAFLLILFLVVRYILGLAQLFFAGVLRGAIRPSGFEVEWAMPTYKLVRVLIIAFALVVAYPYIPGSGSEAFKGISIFMGVLFSLGASGMVANILAGYSLVYRKAFKLGDYVKIGDHVGCIKEVGQMVTRLDTFKNEEVVLPNSTILATDVTNFTSAARLGQLILHTSVTIGYDTPWRQVEAMLLEAAARTQGLLKEPSPFVLRKALGDFYIEYEINAYCDDASRMPRLYSELHAHIIDVFNEYEVQIMSPHFEAQPAEDVLVPKGKWYAAPAQAPQEKT